MSRSQDWARVNAWLYRDDPFYAELARRRRRAMVRPVTVTAVLNGWIVQCGCQNLVYTDARDLARDLVDYLHNPGPVEERFLKGAVNARHMNVVTEAVQTQAMERDRIPAEQYQATDPEQYRTSAVGGPTGPGDDLLRQRDRLERAARDADARHRVR